MKRLFRPLIPAVLALLCVALAAHAETRTCRVRYVSADHVYLDAGRLEGLVEGTDVTITREGREIAVLTVEHAADHSSSCRLEAAVGMVMEGDAAEFLPAAGTADAAPTAEPAPTVRKRSRTEQTRAAQATRTGPRLSGSLALQWEHVEDTSGADLDFDQPGLRYDLRVDRLTGGFTLRARGSLRHDLRTRAYGFAPADEWRSRILEVSLTRLEETVDWQLAVGRIGARVTAAVGPFDGVLVNRSVGGGWRIGAFSGLTPGWNDAANWSDDRVTGLVAHLRRGDRRNGRLDVSVAAVARRQAGEIDRDYLALTGTWQNERLSLTQAAQLDWNRGWRREVDDRAVALSNLLVTGRWRPDDRWRLSLTLDDRDLIRTWTTRSLPDSLFAENGRRGLRAGVTWRSERLTVRADGGLRHDDRFDDATASYGLALDRDDWPAAGLRLGAAVRGFDGPTARGTTPSLHLQHRDRSWGSTRLTVGSRTYELLSVSRRSTGRWIAVAHDRDLGRLWSLAVEARLDGGDDTAGRRWFLELRRRL